MTCDQLTFDLLVEDLQASSARRSCMWRRVETVELTGGVL